MGSSPRMPSPKRHPKTGVFYFRRAVPEGLRATLGKREIKVSLETKNPAEAKQRCTIEAAKCDALFAKAQAGRMTPERAEEVAGAWRDRVRADDGWNFAWDLFDAQLKDPQRQPGPMQRPDEWLQEALESKVPGRLAGLAGKVLAPEETERLGPQGERLLGRELAEVARDHRDTFIPATAAHQAATKAELRKKNWTISEMHQFWINDRRPRPSTEKDWTKAKERFVEIFGDIKVQEITRTHAQEFRGYLRKLPKNPKQNIARLPALKQIAVIEGKHHPLIMPATINKSLLWLKRMLNLAINEDIIDSNPAEGVSQHDNVKAMDKRHSYSPEDLNCIFGSVLFGGEPPQGRVKHPSLLQYQHSRWLPILGLFQGARLNELGQCLKSDVRRELGIDYLWITTLAEDDPLATAPAGSEKSLKTQNAPRKVPLHPVLLELGFLEYVKSLKSRFLFPDLNHTSNQVPTAKFSSYWGPFTRSLGVANERKSFHSFRHCFWDQAEKTMPQIARVTLMGRSAKDTYGSRPDLKELKAWNDQIDYPGLDLALVRRYFAGTK